MKFSERLKVLEQFLTKAFKWLGITIISFLLVVTTMKRNFGRRYENEIFRLPSPDKKLNAIVTRRTSWFDDNQVVRLYITKKEITLKDINSMKPRCKYRYFKGKALSFKHLIWKDNKTLQLGRYLNDEIASFRSKGCIHTRLISTHKAIVELATIQSDGSSLPMKRHLPNQPVPEETNKGSL